MNDERVELDDPLLVGELLALLLLSLLSYRRHRLLVYLHYEVSLLEEGF